MKTLEESKKMECGGIYQIRNLINNKVYIGSTKFFRKRFNCHNSRLKNNVHNSIKLQRSYNKYGDENFIFEIVEILDDISLNNLLKREQYYVDLKDSCHNGYNILGTITPSPILSSYDNPRSKEVLCVNTMIKYGSVAQAGRENKISYSTIASCCRHNSNIAGGLVWIYTDEWNSLDNKTKEYYIKKANCYTDEKEKYIKRDKSYYVRPIRCVETKKVFNSALEASKSISQKSGAHILECCRGLRNACGGYRWEYAD